MLPQPEFLHDPYTPSGTLPQHPGITIFNQLHTGIAIYGDNNQVLYQNPVYERLRKDYNDAIANALNQPIVSAPNGTPVSRLDAVRLGLPSGSPYEVSLTENGPHYKLFLSTSVWATQPSQILAELVDVTQFVEESKSLKRTLGIMQAEKSTILNNLVRLLHDLKNPFTVIQGLAQTGSMILGKNPNENPSHIDQTIGKILSDINAASHNALTMFVQEISGVRLSEKMAKEPLNARALFLTVIQDEHLLNLFKQHGIKVEFTVPEGNYLIMGDPRAIRSAWRNLFTNAISAMETTEEKRLVVSMTAQEAQLTTNVSDTGIGIAKERYQSIFHGDSTKKGAYQHGSGEGLPIALEIAYAHGGNLRLVSSITKEEAQINPKLQQGTTFAFTLPLLQT